MDYNSLEAEGNEFSEYVDLTPEMHEVDALKLQIMQQTIKAVEKKIKEEHANDATNINVRRLGDAFGSRVNKPGKTGGKAKVSDKAKLLSLMLSGPVQLFRLSK